MHDDVKESKVGMFSSIARNAQRPQRRRLAVAMACVLFVMEESSL